MGVFHSFKESVSYWVPFALTPAQSSTDITEYLCTELWQGTRSSSATNTHTNFELHASQKNAFVQVCTNTQHVYRNGIIITAPALHSNIDSLVPKDKVSHKVCHIPNASVQQIHFKTG